MKSEQQVSKKSSEQSDYRLRNGCLSVAINSCFPGWSDHRFRKYLQELPYLQGFQNAYFIFQRETTSEKGEHWQCYLEFNQQVYFKVLQRDFNNAHIEKRRSSQLQAVNYCCKVKSRLTGPYQGGTLKKSGQKREHSKQPLEKIIAKLKKGGYNDFFQMAEDNPLLFEEKKGFLKTIWNRHYPLTYWDTKPAQVIWCWGEKGVGKSVWTEKYLRAANYQAGEIVAIFPNNITYNDQIKFNIDDEQGRVLIINEVDKNFPKNNNLINFIDRKGFLEAKESRIRNNFELLIINSLYRPEEVFSYLGEQVAGQVLRRIFSPFFHCKVYQVKANQAQLQLFLQEKREMSNQQFQDWYQPILEEIEKADDSLITNE